MSTILQNKTGKFGFFWIFNEVIEEVDGSSNAFKQAERSVRNVLLRSDQLCEPLAIPGSSVQPQIVLSHLGIQIIIRLESSRLNCRLGSPDRDEGGHSRSRPLHDKARDLS